MFLAILGVYILTVFFAFAIILWACYLFEETLTVGDLMEIAAFSLLGPFAILLGVAMFFGGFKTKYKSKIIFDRKNKLNKLP